MNSTKSAASSKNATSSSSTNGAPASGTSKPLRLTAVTFESDALVAQFTNGSRVKVDVKRYPRLSQATPAQRKKWRLVGGGLGVHWPAIDEDLSVENLLFAGAKLAARRS